MSVFIKIAKDFSETPGGRYRAEGEFSAEEFRDDILIHKYNEAEKSGTKLEIDFDGGYGYSTGFLEEAFGGLVRKYKKFGILDKLNIISKEDETLPEYIERFVSEAEECANSQQAQKQNI